MNFQDMVDFVRLQADTDADDAPEVTLRVYATAAYNDIKRRVFPWPDKKTRFSFVTTPDTDFYPYALMQIPDLEYVMSATTPTNVMGYVSGDQFNALSLSDVSGNPVVFYADVTGIGLYPKPSSVMEIALVGYRKFVDWPSILTSEPDLPNGFDETICWYMLSKYYAAQEDLELMASYMQDYEISLSHQLEGALRESASTAGPRIFGNQSVMLPSKTDWWN